MENGNKIKTRMFFAVFCVLTVFCWCPFGYGDYGSVDRIFGMPDWAAITFLISIILFILEWIFLFLTDLSIQDDDLPEIFEALKKFQGE